MPAADTIGSTIDLPEDEAAHLARVLRLTTGAEVLVFDGRGREWQAIVDRVTKSSAAVRLVTAISAAPEPAVAIALAMAVLKGDKTDEAIRDAVMLGAASVQPLLTDRSEVRASAVTEWPTAGPMAADCSFVGEAVRPGRRSTDSSRRHAGRRPGVARAGVAAGAGRAPQCDRLRPDGAGGFTPGARSSLHWP